jgi:hypothetical protein
MPKPSNDKSEKKVKSPSVKYIPKDKEDEARNEIEKKYKKIGEITF